METRHRGEHVQYYDLRSALRDEAGLGEMTGAEEYVDRVLLIIQKMLFSIDTSRYANFRLENLVSNEGGFTFSWVSKTEESICPRCGTVSKEKRNTYKSRLLIDEPILGMPVMHCLRLNVYLCAHCVETGASRSFVEEIRAVCRRPYIKTTTNLDEKIVNDAIHRSANGLAKDYQGSIDVSTRVILNRLKEAGGMATEKNLTETDGVKILSLDDNNARKGVPASAYTVAVDTERHIILAVAKGSNSETAKKILQRFPDAEKLSRDRDCAYAKAGKECELEQVADIFHLVVNAHSAVKEAISKGLNYNIYVKEGDGWVELPLASALPEVQEPEGFIAVATLADDDITLRVRLASLSARQEKKYRTVIELLRLNDQGLSSREIDRRLNITSTDRVALFSGAADVINGVEEKIDEYYANRGERKGRQKTIGKRARPSSKSIVEPFGETVMKMAGEGHSHRTIYPEIQAMGYHGSENTIYQYILKKRLEETATPSSAPGFIPDSYLPYAFDASRPPRVSIQRVTKTAVYKFVLHEAAIRRYDPSEESADVAGELMPVDPVGMDKRKKESAFYSDDIAGIIMGQGKESQVKKNGRA